MRKIRAQYIFDGIRLRKNAMLVLSNSEIVSVIDLPDSAVEEAGVEFYNGIVCPGFVNAHCHLELSHLESHIPQGTGLPTFVAAVAQSRTTQAFSLEACKQADEYMAAQGIVAVGDISNSTDSFQVKAQSSITYHTFIELFDLFRDSTPIFSQGKELFRAYPLKNRVSLSPHAPYSCSNKLLAKISAHAAEYQYPVTIHNQEHESENELFQHGKGHLYDMICRNHGDVTLVPRAKSSLHSVLPKLEECAHILFVHNIYTSEHDIDLLQQTRERNSYTFVLCPRSNKYINTMLPPVDMFLSRAVPMAIGTDSLASNSSLSMLEEMRCLQEAFPEFTLEKLLQSATYNGACALQMQSKIGSFTPRKIPGVLLLEHLDLSQLHITPQTKVRVLV